MCIGKHLSYQSYGHKVKTISNAQPWKPSIPLDTIHYKKEKCIRRHQTEYIYVVILQLNKQHAKSYLLNVAPGSLQWFISLMHQSSPIDMFVSLSLYVLFSEYDHINCLFIENMLDIEAHSYSRLPNHLLRVGVTWKETSLRYKCIIYKFILYFNYWIIKPNRWQLNAIKYVLSLKHENETDW